MGCLRRFSSTFLINYNASRILNFEEENDKYVILCNTVSATRKLHEFKTHNFIPHFITGTLFTPYLSANADSYTSTRGYSARV